MNDTDRENELTERVHETVRKALQLVGHAENGVESAEETPVS